MNKYDIDNDDSKYILIDRSDPNLMWNCAVSIIVFAILLFFLFMNWKPKCFNDAMVDNIIATIDGDSVVNSFGSSLGGFTSKRVL